MTKKLKGNNTTGAGDCSVYLPWKTFFPCFEEKYLFCNKNIKITL